MHVDQFAAADGSNPAAKELGVPVSRMRHLDVSPRSPIRNLFRVGTQTMEGEMQAVI
jgi:hypothetical protein